jgi:hypothetical protein
MEFGESNVFFSSVELFEDRIVVRVGAIVVDVGVELLGPMTLTLVGTTSTEPEFVVGVYRAAIVGPYCADLTADPPTS